MKVAIIGAGTCGLYLAWKLAEKGEVVTVFEKKKKIGKEVCSGLFSERILDFIPESKNLTQNKIDYCLIHWVGGGWRSKGTLKIKFRRKFLVMSHFELDNLVANLTEKTRTKIILNYNVTRTLLVTMENRFDRIIGCNGAVSFVRKKLGLKEPQFCLGMRGFLPKTDFSNYVETWPTKDGFIWRIPRGREIEYGIIEDPKNARTIFEKFLKENSLKLERINSAIIPQGLIIPSNPQITLCGDAIGLTKPWSGGGVIWGLIAANILLKNFPDFLKYKNAVKKFFLPKIIFSKIATKLVYFFGYKIPWLLPEELEIEGDFLI